MERLTFSNSAQRKNDTVSLRASVPFPGVNGWQPRNFGPEADV
jgi:hypothetical protein